MGYYVNVLYGQLDEQLAKNLTIVKICWSFVIIFFAILLINLSRKKIKEMTKPSYYSK